MSRSETDREIIERTETKATSIVETVVGVALTAGCNLPFISTGGHQTTITDKDSGASVTGSGSSQSEADRNAWDRLESVRRR